MTERTKSITPQWYRLLSDHRHNDPDEIRARAHNWRTCAIGEALDLESLPTHERPHYQDENSALAMAFQEKCPRLHNLGCEFYHDVEYGYMSRAQETRRRIQAFILHWGIDVIRAAIAEHFERSAERQREAALDAEVWKSMRKAEREAVLEAAAEAAK